MSRKDELLKIISDAQSELISENQRTRNESRQIAQADLNRVVELAKSNLREAVEIANMYGLSFEVYIDNSAVDIDHNGNSDWDSSSAYC